MKKLKTTTKTQKFQYNRDVFIKEIEKEGKILNLHSGSVSKIAEKTADNIEKWLKTRTDIAEKDFNYKVSEELEKYQKDLAYIYKNRGKII